jgi:hypothetical protein
VRRIAVIGVIVAALAACGVSAASIQARPRRIVFGLGGGNIVPFRVTTEPDGRVHSRGFMRPRRHRLSLAKVSSLTTLVRYEFASGLRSRQCAGTNPDIGSHYISALGRTVSVHGRCERRFSWLWNSLARAVRV